MEDIVRTHVELGCGNNKRTGFFGIDFAPGPQVDLVVNVERDRLPFPDNSVEHLYSSHMFEHLTYQQHAWREVFRVCKPGALAEIWTPYGKSNDGLLFGHLTFFTETSFKHICYEYDRAYLEDRHGFFEWYETHYVLHPNVVERLSIMKTPIELALDHMMNIGLEWGVYLRVRKDLPRAPGVQIPNRRYTVGNRNTPIETDQLNPQPSGAPSEAHRKPTQFLRQLLSVPRRR
ncbi:methyltransferase domain-containing protein [Reyranella sp. CPCC 100927]|uniref:class I SAM-dependent methyltransferase n=1 Tax=Reyranella sp. CPCC 100927 TaxID=2599616 RepID=UPI0011B76278|nr:methyltransferase domain-containing protein [Reyranella sp. CPCC 100927]TWT12897.1 methyltransferase domain-containing protein [Reyranella sp. CPCC 100927]